jgi:hypothetical protein
MTDDQKIAAAEDALKLDAIEAALDRKLSTLEGITKKLWSAHPRDYRYNTTVTLTTKEFRALCDVLRPHCRKSFDVMKELGRYD